MIVNWDIDNWANNELHPELRDSGGTNISVLRILLKPVRFLYDAFTAFRTDTLRKMNYNGQAFVLQNLLNDLFDPNRNIIVYTDSDILPHTYIYLKQEPVAPLYIFTKAEHGAHPGYTKVYLYTQPEYGNTYDFIVQAKAGSLTAEQIVQLKATVNRYKVAGKRPHYQYDNKQPF